MSLESKACKGIAKALKNNDTRKAASITKKYLRDLDSIPLNIAVTGVSGSGKSTFINAFRGIGDEDEGAAPTGPVETTMVSEAYTHPKYPNVTLWDLPGIGTPKFSADQYLKDVGFEKFDFFIIVSSDRFRENDAKLANEIKNINKTFYFVRAKIDQNLSSEKRKKKYDEEKTLQEIKENCIKGLEEQGVTAPQVFLVSNYDLQLYDFPALQETMESDLPSHKRNVLILALPKILKSNINKKKEVLCSQIKYYALLSALVAALPIPGLSIIADLVILVGVIQQYLSEFGLDEKSLEKLSSDTKKPLDELQAVLKYICSGKDLTKELLEEMVLEKPQPEIGVLAKVIKWLPVIGIPIAATCSYNFIEMFLNHVLDSLAVDAENVLIKAFGHSEMSGNAVASSGEEQ